jgi:hypothetical protein
MYSLLTPKKLLKYKGEHKLLVFLNLLLVGGRIRIRKVILYLFFFSLFLKK